MSFHNWYSKSITEAQERYKKEDKENQTNVEAKRENERLENQYYDMSYGSVPTSMGIDEDEEDLLRLEDDGGWHGI